MHLLSQKRSIRTSGRCKRHGNATTPWQPPVCPYPHVYAFAAVQCERPSPTHKPMPTANHPTSPSSFQFQAGPQMQSAPWLPSAPTLRFMKQQGHTRARSPALDRAQQISANRSPLVTPSTSCSCRPAAATTDMIIITTAVGPRSKSLTAPVVTNALTAHLRAARPCPAGAGTSSPLASRPAAPSGPRTSACRP